MTIQISRVNLKSCEALQPRDSNSQLQFYFPLYKHARWNPAHRPSVQQELSRASFVKTQDELTVSEQFRRFSYVICRRDNKMIGKYFPLSKNKKSASQDTRRIFRYGCCSFTELRITSLILQLKHQAMNVYMLCYEYHGWLHRLPSASSTVHPLLQQE